MFLEDCEKMQQHRFTTVEYVMGFQKVDSEMGCAEVDEDTEYVKVEKVDADMEYEEEEMDADVEDREAGDEGISILPPCPFQKRREDMDLQDLVKGIVLPYLPAKALFRFRSVSKEWNRRIGNPFLAHQQSYYFKDFSGFFCQYAAGQHTFLSLGNTAYGVPFQSLEPFPEYVNIISSCSGLLLCHGRDALDPYYVWNPATRQWARLPLPELYHGDDPSAVLAFEPCALNTGSHYQVVCVIPTSDYVLFELYSSGTGSWRVSETTLVEMEDSRIKGDGFYMKGVAYMGTSTRTVIAFHLETEVYEVIPLPRGTPQDGVLTQLRGELCYVGLSRSSKNEYSVMIYMGMDLGLRFRMDVKIGPELMGRVLYRALPCLDGDNAMILVGSVIYCYRIGDQSVKEVARVGNSASHASAKYLPYVNSLVHVAKP